MRTGLSNRFCSVYLCVLAWEAQHFKLNDNLLKVGVYNGSNINGRTSGRSSGGVNGIGSGSGSNSVSYGANQSLLLAFFALYILVNSRYAAASYAASQRTYEGRFRNFFKRLYRGNICTTGYALDDGLYGLGACLSERCFTRFLKYAAFSRSFDGLCPYFSYSASRTTEQVKRSTGYSAFNSRTDIVFTEAFLRTTDTFVGSY